MNKNLLMSIAVITAVMILPGCKKACDYFENHPDADLRLCNIQKFIYTTSHGGGIKDTMFFNYNLKGDPVTIMRSQVGTGSPNFFFKYDNAGRLTDLIGAYSANYINDEFIEGWHKYFYDASNRIVKDSFYFFPTIVNGHPTIGKYGNIIMIYYEYDSKNRISKYTEDQGGESVFIDNYVYNQNGNIKGSSYDNKINYNRTNKIWQFMNRDYSANNTLPASIDYNQVGLPVKILAPKGADRPFFNVSEDGVSFAKGEIEYLCK